MDGGLEDIDMFKMGWWGEINECQTLTDDPNLINVTSHRINEFYDVGASRVSFSIELNEAQTVAIS